MKNKIVKTICRIIALPFACGVLGSISVPILMLVGLCPFDLFNIFMSIVGLIVFGLIFAALMKLEKKLTGEEDI